MPLTHLLPWILTAIVASIAGMMSGVMSNMPALSWAAAGLYAAALVAVAIDVNRPWWSHSGAAADYDAAVFAAIRNARILVLGYLWGSLALIFIYRMTGLRWQHGLQYAAGMAAIAWLILLYVHFLARPESALRAPKALLLATRLSLAHGLAAFAGLVFLVVSGKILSVKADWAANQVFMAGGLAVLALSVVSAYTQFRLGVLRRGRTQPGVDAPTSG